MQLLTNLVYALVIALSGITIPFASNIGEATAQGLLTLVLLGMYINTGPKSPHLQTTKTYRKERTNK